ncbi:MAG: hypothetical protein QXG98_00775 [Candidatus Micrarchaeia archaeon]
MLTPCEEVLRIYLPALKASVAKELAERYAWRQEDIATLLGVTQAAISKYHAGRYSRKIKQAEGKMRKLAARIAKDIASRKVGKGEVAAEMCAACKSLRSIDSECAYRLIGEILRK